MNLRSVRLVAAHDLLDLRRQRSIWLGLLLIPFVTVSFLLLLPGILAGRESDQQARAVYRVAVQGSADDVKALAGALPPSRFDLVARNDAASVVTAKRADVGLVLETATSTLERPDGQVRGRLLVLSGRSRSRAGAGAVAQALDRSGLAIADARLAEVGLSPAAVRPITTMAVDLSTTPRGRRLGLATALPLLVLLPLSGTVGVAAQRISGSKDQRVFEPLLLLPFRRAEILLGKALATLAIGSVTLLAVVLPLYGARFMPVGDGGQPVELPFADISVAVGLGGALLCLLVVLGTTVGSASRTSAELGSVLQMATLPVFLLGSLLQFRSGIVTTPQLLVLPFFGLLLCVRDIAIGALTAGHGALAVAATAAWCTALLAIGNRALNSERSVIRTTN